MTTGSLTCVGVGMMLGAHICPISRSHIEHADIVFSAMSDGFVEKWLEQLNPNVHSLQPLYGKDKPRHQTYKEMVQTIVEAVKQNKKVVAAFYGHPGVFVKPAHQAIEQVKALGVDASMVPGISAEACLYADLGMDPGKQGCQHYEASQFMLYQRRIDTSAMLVLWQIGVAGDLSMGISTTGVAERRLLLELLAEDYSLEHDCWLYEAATMPLMQPRMEQLPLKGILQAEFHQHTTLVIPPEKSLVPNTHMRQRLKFLQQQATNISKQDNNVIPFNQRGK
ncbi:uroporphyrin-III methyltransferase [Shewanella mangrovi]|uniref:Uroporphyrin-III methyltransferase n=1 Tax=Shewanella mangrovi TaxID=1515746 RepID=A0A094JX01_9GAMM|nr:SAM-dependent methyltransferase [Shewanella mangrovi]KFZ36946.1 uroporphyrin-III methyltransferase [Shewanella mangrovi]